ncbi:hypothetical protein [Nonomuraea sp. NPDC003804]|uniref:hypothetical protein n=1 Tax=Nonomuraea sp. NPDC003804 TaxID=3154547 RepID=UPI0033B86EC3
MFAVIPPTESEPRIVDDFIRHLNRLLKRHNAARNGDDRLRLRVAAHVGVVSAADNGFAGEPAVVVGRLLDSAPLRAAIAAADDAHLALLLSRDVYQGTVAGGYTTVEPSDFRQVKIQVKKYSGEAWLFVPGADVHGLDLPEATGAAEAAPSAKTAGQVVHTVFHGDVRLDGGVIGISNN